MKLLGFIVGVIITLALIASEAALIRYIVRCEAHRFVRALTGPPGQR